MNTTTNSQHLLIAQDIATTGAGLTTDSTSATYIADGEVVVTDEAGSTVIAIANVANYPKIRICQRSGDKLIWSPVIAAADLVSYKGSAYAAATEQLTFVGYNTTGESIDVINSNVYLMRIIRQDTQATFLNKEMMKFATYKSDSSATQSEIALGLAASAIANFAREAEKEIAFGAVCSEAVTTANCFDNDATVVNGSKVVSVATNLQYNSGAGTAAAGDFVRLGTEAMAVGATALGSNVYKIVSVSGTDITLDRPVEVASGTYTAAGNMAEVLTAAEGAAADWGVKMLGQARDFTAGSFKYSKVRFEVTLAEDFGSTVVTKDTAATEGVGMYEQVAELEWFLGDGAYGKVERIGTPSPTFKTDAVSGDGYSWLEIAANSKSHVGVAGPAISKVEVKIAISKGTAGGGGLGSSADDNTYGFVDILDDWVAAFGVGTAQEGNL
jgi:hypothetical protein